MPAASKPLLAAARRGAQRDLMLMRETALRIRYDWNEIDAQVRDAADALIRAIAGVGHALDRVTPEAGPELLRDPDALQQLVS